VSLLPNKPSLANSARVRRSADEGDAVASDEDRDSVDGYKTDEEDRNVKADTSADTSADRDDAAANDSAELADVTADESASGREDRHSPSPAPQGASCTEGGRFRGRANGNAFSFGDTPAVDALCPLMGRVVLYDSHASNAEPVFAVKQPVAPDLKSVLSSLASKFSPIRSEFFVSSHSCCILKCWWHNMTDTSM
jgi:hypothetical protein